MPVRDDRTLFEFLTLEGAQAGLSWLTILRKRAGYRAAFAGFDPARVARFDDQKVSLLISNPAIVRNRLKIQSAVRNAQALLSIQEEHGSFASYIWAFIDDRPIQNGWTSMSQVPSTTPLAERISRDLVRWGFRFVGPTIVYAHMQATGMVNDHLVGCFRHAEVAELG